MVMDQDSLHHPPPTSHRWLLYHNRDRCHSPYKTDARTAEALYIDVIIGGGGGGKVKVRSGGPASVKDQPLPVSSQPLPARILD